MHGIWLCHGGLDEAERIADNRKVSGMEDVSHPQAVVHFAVDRVDLHDLWRKYGDLSAAPTGRREVQLQHLPVCEQCTFWVSTLSRALQEVRHASVLAAQEIASRFYRLRVRSCR